MTQTRNYSVHEELGPSGWTMTDKGHKNVRQAMNNIRGRELQLK